MEDEENAESFDLDEEDDEMLKAVDDLELDESD